jgi:hypothetical protein
VLARRLVALEACLLSLHRAGRHRTRHSHIGEAFRAEGSCRTRGTCSSASSTSNNAAGSTMPRHAPSLPPSRLSHTSRDPTHHPCKPRVPSPGVVQPRCPDGSTQSSSHDTHCSTIRVAWGSRHPVVHVPRPPRRRRARPNPTARSPRHDWLVHVLTRSSTSRPPSPHGAPAGPHSSAREDR